MCWDGMEQDHNLVLEALVDDRLAQVGDGHVEVPRKQVLVAYN